MTSGLIGGSSSDNLTGDGGANSIDGFSGADVIDGKEGPDLLHGAAGDDTLNGSEGADTIYGDANVDNADGGPGDGAQRGDVAVRTRPHLQHQRFGRGRRREQRERDPGLVVVRPGAGVHVELGRQRGSDEILGPGLHVSISPVCFLEWTIPQPGRPTAIEVLNKSIRLNKAVSP